MKIAIEGCCHGELDAIYSHIHRLEEKNNYKVDLLLICGDFQAVRNYQDLQCMAVPDKYKELKHFYKYYTGEQVAPILTIVIGGNHEASNYMWELYHGGWLAQNIYFLGHAGCVQVNGIRIAGASGIFKSNDFKKGNFEKMPYDHGTMRSIYHIREYCVRKLSLLSSANIFLSHDWPQSIEHYGDLQGLLHKKKFLRPDIESEKLGSPPLMGLLRTLKPDWWFSAHLHTRYDAVVVHSSDSTTLTQPLQGLNPDEITIEDEDDSNGPAVEEQMIQPTNPEVEVPRNPEEIHLEDEEEDVVAPLAPLPPPSETRFLALDKCLPRRQFLEVIDLETDPSQTGKVSPPILSFDPEWLAISRAFHPWLSLSRQQRPFPLEVEARGMVSTELDWVMKNVPGKLGGGFNLSECQTFVPTATGSGSVGVGAVQQPSWYTNPQTVAFCSLLDITNKINPPPPGSHPTSTIETSDVDSNPTKNTSLAHPES